MLNPWIKSHAGLEHHRKLLVFKARMRWSKNEAVGFLHRFWWTVMTQVPSGLVSSLPPEVVSGTLDMSPEQWAVAMREMEAAGFLDRRGNHLLVHDWIDHAGRYLKDSLWKHKKNLWLEACRLHGRDPSADSQPTVGGPSALEGEEIRREEKTPSAPQGGRVKTRRGRGETAEERRERQVLAAAGLIPAATAGGGEEADDGDD